MGPGGEIEDEAEPGPSSNAQKKKRKTSVTADAPKTTKRLKKSAIRPFVFYATAAFRKEEGGKVYGIESIQWSEGYDQGSSGTTKDFVERKFQIKDTASAIPAPAEQISPRLRLVAEDGSDDMPNNQQQHRMIEKFSATNEELTAAKEELTVANEELKAVKEELSTENRERQNAIEGMQLADEEKEERIEIQTQRISALKADLAGHLVPQPPSGVYAHENASDALPSATEAEVQVIQPLNLDGQRFEQLWFEIPEDYTKARVFQSLPRTVVENGKRYEETIILVEGIATSFVKQLPTKFLREHSNKMYIALVSRKELEDKNFFVRG
ncbi:uncharacterized protein PAC_01724 [Phialocephala subalpina]|uniref:Uncharacterized protein n=1 Tax=Phialocephala subalpina TaxID=576137 RepID=A0A1L7WGI4_9HELO|nr:uncharacterized protein PAC_01724 [Phialocephala subalpina]